MSAQSTRSNRAAIRALAAAMASVAVAGTAWAQGHSPTPQLRISQDVFVTASIDALPLLSVPRTIAILTREDLERIGVTSVIDALRLLPAVDPRARGPKGVQTDFSVRGSTFGQNLVLLDGVRLNDSQTGHHNGEVPLTIDGIDRIEVLYGAGSAVHGADALGGTINIISRQDAHAGLTVEGGQYGYASASGSLSGRWLPSGWTLGGWGNRSGGFMFDRDFVQGGASLRAAVTPTLTLDVRHARRAFGANGFYGDSPSKEWTDQTLASAQWQHVHGSLITEVRASARDHHDHFLWDIARPGFAENRHHSDGADAAATVTRAFADGRRATAGVSFGHDWIASSNLGDHAYSRTSVFGDVSIPAGARSLVHGGLRLDAYSTFGRSLNPSIAVSTQATSSLRLNASASRGFRIPTFTELYYSDPANLGTPTLTPETSWSLDSGVEWSSLGWTWTVTPFRRWDRNVIDWLRPSPADKWRSTNVRDVAATGVETSLAKRWGSGMVRLSYAGLHVDAPALTLQSKYVLEYARHQIGGSLSLPIGQTFRVALNVDHRRRFDGQAYGLVGARVTRRFARADVFVDGSNLLNETYHEIVGVAMPGRWVTAGVTLH
ncbi:MAG: TonB-dependent receptor [Acidobacteria bacterium]|nr:TonB-dependent receptor [Acidobacteriota bacterium]